MVQSIQILEYHPKMLQDYLQGSDNIGFMYPRLVFITRTTCLDNGKTMYMMMEVQCISSCVCLCIQGHSSCEEEIIYPAGLFLSLTCHLAKSYCFLKLSSEIS